MVPRVQIGRLMSSIDSLTSVSDRENGSSTRVALTDADRRGRDLVVSWMRRDGLEVTIDVLGNIMGVRPGQVSGPPVLMGSHLDTVSSAGRYDGAYGVLAALEVVRCLAESGERTQRPVGIAAFTNEEGVRFSPDLLGSRAFVGEVSVQSALAAQDLSGTSVGDELLRIGYAGQNQCPHLSPHAYIELHVEQGPVLDTEGAGIGVVDAVCGSVWMEALITGEANHAGTTPMHLRHDAGYAAGRVITSVRSVATDAGGDQVGTVGRITVYPNETNVVPGRALVTLDLRSSDGARLRETERQVRERAYEIAGQEGVTVEFRNLASSPAVSFDDRVVAIIEDVARDLGHQPRRMRSGASHDAQVLAGVCPTAMVFVPSVGGVSHSPLEYTGPADLAAGADVLLHAVLRLANGPDL